MDWTKIDNSSIDYFINSMKPIFKEITGLDLDNHTHEEYQNWYHSAMRKEAENDPYTREILSSVEHIIEEKDYSQLFAIMKNYDTLVKERSNNVNDMKLPYWCYGFGLRPEEE